LPPRGSCAACGIATTDEVELSDKATVKSFTIVHIPIPGSPVKPPYVVANLVADGANIAFIHLLSECKNEDVHIGMRLLKNIAVVGLHWGAYAKFEPERIPETMQALLALHEKGAIQPEIYRSYPLEQASEALVALGSRGTWGKVVLAP
jgi:NADPH:quinone reductase-like Zn-dependent oxidoreductase